MYFAVSFRNNHKNPLIVSNKRASIEACFFVIWFAASGRDFVRVTFLSKSTSTMSLIMQPALRVIIAPKKNNK